MANISQRVGFAVELSLTAPFSGSFDEIGNPLDENPVVIVFDNQSDVSVEISVNGTDTWKTFSAGEAFVLDLRANHGIATNYTIDLRTQFYGRGTAGSGSFFISYVFAR